MRKNLNYNQGMKKKEKIVAAPEALTAMQRFNRAIKNLRLASFIATIVSLLWNTAFSLYIIFSRFGSYPVFGYVSLGILAVYIGISAGFFAYAKNNKERNKAVKDYKRGVGIFKGVLNLLYAAMLVTIIAGARGADNSFMTAFITLLFAIVSLSIKVAIFSISKVMPKLFKFGAEIAIEVAEEKIKEYKLGSAVLKFAQKKKRANKGEESGENKISESLTKNLRADTLTGGKTDNKSIKGDEDSVAFWLGKGFGALLQSAKCKLKAKIQNSKEQRKEKKEQKKKDKEELIGKLVNEKIDSFQSDFQTAADK